MDAITILDGGMGRELARAGAPFRQPEWSALALIEAPSVVRDAHAAFAAAGADLLTANTYAVVPFHVGEERFAARGRALADLAGRLAREAADGASRHVRVAGSLPPLFGSYRPDLFDPARAPAIVGEVVRGLAPHVDLWLAETLGSIAEAEAAAAAVAADDRPLLVSFTLLDGDAAADAPPRLRSGEPVALAAVRAAARRDRSPLQLQPARGHGPRDRRGPHGGRRRAAARRLRERLPAAARRRRSQRGAARDPRRPDAAALPGARARVGGGRRDARRRLLRDRALAHVAALASLRGCGSA